MKDKERKIKGVFHTMHLRANVDWIDYEEFGKKIPEIQKIIIEENLFEEKTSENIAMWLKHNLNNLTN